MMEDLRGGSMEYVCQRFTTREKRRAIDDYESFLYSISVVSRQNWFSSAFDNKIRKTLLGKSPLEKIIKAFADEVFTNNASKKFPDYNNLEKKISSAIKKIHPNGPPKFSWITDPDAKTNPERKITDIPDPKPIDFNTFEYPPVMSLNNPILPVSTSIPTKRPSKKLFGCLT